MAKYCSLAMEFTPTLNNDVMSALLSNRCLAFTSSKKFKEALADAKECIALKPEWFRVSSFLYLKHHTSEWCPLTHSDWLTQVIDLNMLSKYMNIMHEKCGLKSR